MNGLGAWYLHGGGVEHRYYLKGDGALPLVRTPTEIELFVASACMSVKRELLYLGYQGIGTKNHKLGTGAGRAIKHFQRDHGLEVDGVVGPRTAIVLYTPRLIMLETAEAIPERLARKLVRQESAYDPGAQGFSTPSDWGLAQINTDFSDVTHDEAGDGDFSLGYIADRLVASFASAHDWDGAVAAYNLGLVRAVLWVNAGKPASGLVTSSGFDYAEAATRYVAQVRGQVV